jgi:glucose-6-phosphate isomerase
MFGFWDWVGGRYSVDSAIGLSVMAVIGRERFAEFLAGFHLVDEHFRTAPLDANAPVLLGLIGSGTTTSSTRSRARCCPTPTTCPGSRPTCSSSPWNPTASRCAPTARRYHTDRRNLLGEPGTNGQHAFYQLLHQGTRLIPADFIGFSEPTDDLPTADGDGSMHDLLMSNFFAQTQVLAFGRDAAEIARDLPAGTPADVVPHKVMPGNRPSTSILATKLTPSWSAN